MDTKPRPQACRVAVLPVTYLAPDRFPCLPSSLCRSPLLSEGDFEAKPSVLLLGQYSTGKSTFIKYLLVREQGGHRGRGRGRGRDRLSGSQQKFSSVLPPPPPATAIRPFWGCTWTARASRWGCE